MFLRNTLKKEGRSFRNIAIYISKQGERVTLANGFKFIKDLIERFKHDVYGKRQ